jgi:hypothetical protein
VAKRNRLVLVHKTPAPAVEVQQPKMIYGWQPAAATNQIPVHVEDTYLLYQAHSYLGRRVSIEEARELFTRIDIHTRQPIEQPKPKPWWVRLIRL